MKKSISAVSWVSDVNVKFAYQYYTPFKHSKGFNMVRKMHPLNLEFFSLHINFTRIVVSICKIRFKFEMDLKTLTLILILLMNVQSFSVLSFFFLFLYPLLSVC